MKCSIAAMAVGAVVVGGTVNMAHAQAPLEEHLYVMHSNGTHVRRLTHNRGEDFAPDWQPLP